MGKIQFNSIIKIIFLFIILISPINIFGQEQADTVIENEETVYVIREMSFNIDGRTKPYALISNGEFKEGEYINGKTNLDRYLAQRRQLLINKQLFEEVNVDYTTGTKEADGAIPLKLLVYVKDSWNFIILPYPKYDSNEGFSITLKARDYNFLGTMSDLKVDLGYSLNDEDRSINFSVESDTPFHAAGLLWNFRFDHFFNYTFNQPLYYQNITGLSANLPWGNTNFTAGINQYLTVNEENNDEDIEIYGLDDRYSGTFGSTELFVSWKIPFGFEVGNYGELSYTPGLSGRVNYPIGSGSLDEPRKPLATFSHSFGFGKIDWIGNYRKGISAYIDNDYIWYFSREDAPIRITFNSDFKFYWILSKYFGVSFRFNYRQWWQWSSLIDDWIPYYGAADLIRGVLDNDIRAYNMFSLNLDFPFRLLRFWPSEWFKNDKLKFLNFEMHFSPFTDLALFNGPYNKLKDSDNPSSYSTKFSLKDMINTAGLEIIVFPDFFKSLKIRGSIGYNLRKILDDGFSLKWGFFPAWDEIFIGLDHSY